MIEDIARFVLRLDSFEELKQIRHMIKPIESEFYSKITAARDSEGDPGRKPFEIEESRDSLKSLLIANFKRAEETLRTLEEVFKYEEQKKACRIFKECRFQIYTLEKKIMISIKKKFDLSLYLVTDSRHSTLKLEKVVEEAILGGVTFVQLREKHLSDKEILEIGARVKQVCAKYKTPLIIDDRPDLCLVLDLDGVHLGQNDMPIKAARQIIGFQKIIGKSTHSLDQAKAAVKEDIDYFAFGPLFATPTKDYTPVGLKKIDEIKKISRESGIPVVFIGGITNETIDLVVAQKAASIAVVREIMAAENPKKAAEKLKK